MVHQTEDTPLSDRGIAQAESVAKRLKNQKINVIFSSTHKRTKQTAKIISEFTGAPIEYWEELIELKTPSEIQKRHVWDPKSVEIRDLIRKNFSKKGWRYSDEETYEEIEKRAGIVVEHLLDEHQKENVLCVSHASMIKAIISKMVFGKRLTAQIFSDIRYGFWATNTGISVCEYVKGRGWGIISWNDSSHL